MNAVRRSVVLTYLLFSALAPVARGEEVDPASWAPAEPLAFVGISDVERLTEQYKNTAFYKLAQDPVASEVAGEINVVIKFIESFKTRLAGALDIPPAELKSPFGGAAGLYLLRPEKAGDPPSVVLVAGVKDMDLMQSYYRKASTRFREISTSHTRDDFSSFTIDCYTSTPAEAGAEKSSEPNEPFSPGMTDDALGEMVDKMLEEIFSPNALPEKFATCLTTDRLILAPTADEIKAVLRRERGADTLERSEDYLKLKRVFEPLGPVRFLIHVPGWIAMAEAQGGDDAKRTISAMGLSSLRSAIGHISYDNKDVESKIELLQLVSGERTGVVKILSMPNIEVAPPKIIPPKSLFCGWINLNVGEMVNEVERITRGISPDQADMMREQLESLPMPSGKPIQLRRELENFIGPLVLSTEMQLPFSPDAARLLLGIGIRDRSMVDQLFAALTEAMPITQRDSASGSVYDVSFLGLTFAPTHSFLLIGNSPAVEAATRSADGDGLAAEASFRRVAAHLPREAWGVMFVDSRRIWEASLELHRHRATIQSSVMTNPSLAIVSQMLTGMTMSIREDKLQNAKALLPYQGVGMVTIATTPDGIHLKQILMKPD